MASMLNPIQASMNSDENGFGVSPTLANLVGGKLRSAREEKRLTPSQIAFRIKLRKLYIEAIEGGNWDVLPQGLNTQAFIRQYAKELGLSIPEFEEIQGMQERLTEIAPSTTLSPELAVDFDPWNRKPELSASILPALPSAISEAMREEAHEKKPEATQKSGMFALSPVKLLLLFLLLALSGFLVLYTSSK